MIETTDDSGLVVLTQLQGVIESQPFLETAAAIWLANTRKRYLNQTAPDGTTWPESRAAMLRAQQGVGGGTLYDSGTLFNSIQPLVEKGAIGLFTDVPYADKHQRGTDGMIKREFLGFAEEDSVAVGAVILQSLMEPFL